MKKIYLNLSKLSDGLIFNFYANKVATIQQTGRVRQLYPHCVLTVSQLDVPIGKYVLNFAQLCTICSCYPNKNLYLVCASGVPMNGAPILSIDW